MTGTVWVVFYHGRRELLRYTWKEESPGERRETKKLLSEEKGIPVEEITVVLVREKKRS